MIKPLPGTKKKINTLLDIQKVFQTSLTRTLRLIGGLDSEHAKRLIHDPRKTGRIYNFKGRIHQASAPGEAPANKTGALARSISFKIRGASQVEIGAGMEYGKHLELGTQKIKKRPFLRRTAQEREQDTIRLLRREIIKGFSRR